MNIQEHNTPVWSLPTVVLSIENRMYLFTDLRSTIGNFPSDDITENAIKESVGRRPGHPRDEDGASYDVADTSRSYDGAMTSPSDVHEQDSEEESAKQDQAERKADPHSDLKDNAEGSTSGHKIPGMTLILESLAMSFRWQYSLTLKAGLHLRRKHKHKHQPRVNRGDASTGTGARSFSCAWIVPVHTWLMLALGSSRFTRGLCLRLCLRRTCKPALSNLAPVFIVAGPRNDLGDVFGFRKADFSSTGLTKSIYEKDREYFKV